MRSDTSSDDWMMRVQILRIVRARAAGEEEVADTDDGVGVGRVEKLDEHEGERRGPGSCAARGSNPDPGGNLESKSDGYLTA